MRERQTIVISGAGIGGLAAALALSRAGYRIIIAERATELSEAGAGIQLSPNAGRVLAGLGLDARIAEAAIEPEAIEVRNAAGGALLTSVPGRAFRERFGFPYRVIHRADLQTMLVAAVRADSAIRLEVNAIVLQHLPQGDGMLVRIRKPGGVEVVPAVAVIGADGVWSTFREAIPQSARPKATGTTAWRAMVPADVARGLAPLDRVGLWLDRSQHLVHYPIARGAAVNIVAIVKETMDKRGWSSVGERAEIVRRFAHWPEAARKLIGAPVAWQKFPLLTVDPAAAWTTGRLALLGDSAHAMVPFLAQGAAMAMEDAMVLAGCLYGATDVPGALAKYEASRKARVARVASAAEDTARRYHDRGAMAFARDLALKVAGAKLILDRNAWIYDWRAPELGAATATEAAAG